MADAIRLELAEAGENISVTSVKPASVNTPFYSDARTRLGVKPRGVPPIYQPDLVAGAVLYAAEHPVRDLVVGGAGKLLMITRRLSPRLADRVVRRLAFRGQMSDEPKSEQAPDNLYVPAHKDFRVKGDFTDEAKAFSLYTWWQLHPPVQRAVTGTLLGAALGLYVSSRTLRRNARHAHPPSVRERSLEQPLFRLLKGRSGG